MTPKVSIVIPTYNRSATLRKTIAAVQNQTYSNWELIVSDDASTDNTREVVEQFEDGRIRYYRNEDNLGLYGNWNHAIKLTRGEYVAIYHDHDVYLPTIIERSVALLDKYPSASFVHTAHLMVDENDVPVDVDVRAFPELMPGTQMMRLLANSWYSPVMAPTAMVRSTAYDQVGLYNYERFGLACDMDMWFRLAHIGDVAYVDSPQAFWRLRTRGQFTSVFRWSDIEGSIRMRKEHLARVPDYNVLERSINNVKYILQRDRYLTVFMIRAVLLEPRDTILEGHQIVQMEGSPWLVWLSAILQNSEALQRVLRNHFLPMHYKAIDQAETHRRQKARDYLRVSGDQSILSMLRTNDSASEESR